jgi:2-polyprenyl-3-methyl-5-hydroxy-6-metoxy-1,4-benzoquinol methylase
MSILDQIMSPAWPVAVQPGELCDPNSEEDKISRADAIIDSLIGKKLADKRILDFGCGEGHLGLVASRQRAKLVVNYDTQPRHFPGVETANAWEAVSSFGQFDDIFLFDVLDHSVEPLEILRKVRSVVSPGGRIHVRCHPWCSRHGGHDFKINKAWAHLFLGDQDLASLGVSWTTVQKIIHPQATYAAWFLDSGFSVFGSNLRRQPVEEFFSAFHKEAVNTIKSHWASSPDQDLRSGKRFPSAQMEQTWLDYTLAPA